MATNAGQLAGMQQGLSELRGRLLFVLFALLVYRVGTHIPLPGINPEQLRALFEHASIAQLAPEIVARQLKQMGYDGLAEVEGADFATNGVLHD